MLVGTNENIGTFVGTKSENSIQFWTTWLWWIDACCIWMNSLECHFPKWQPSSKVISGILFYKERNSASCYSPTFLKTSLTSALLIALQRLGELQGVFWVERRRHSFACAKTWMMCSGFSVTGKTEHCSAVHLSGLEMIPSQCYWALPSRLPDVLQECLHFLCRSFSVSVLLWRLKLLAATCR